MNIQLTQPFLLKQNIHLKNRLIKSALSENLANTRGEPDRKLFNLYRQWAEGDVAALISGNMMIDRRFRSEIGNVILDQHSDLAAFKTWTAIVKAKHGDIHFWAQINHPGKQSPSYLSWEPVAPSAIALKDGLRTGFNKPRELMHTEILDIIGMFATTAQLCQQVGFTGVQIHAAHGYLINQFLSPQHNQRQDQWGGHLENRMRFLIEVYKAVREAVGDDFPVLIKLNSADFQKGGFSEEDFLTVVQTLSDLGIDMIEISGGSYEKQTMIGQYKKTSTQQREAYFIEYAEKIRKSCQTPIMLTGGFESQKAMNQALSENATDLIGLGRAFCIHPQVGNLFLRQKDFCFPIRYISTGIASIDRLFVLNISWYGHQLEKLAANQQTQPNMKAWYSVYRTVAAMGLNAFQRTRI